MFKRALIAIAVLLVAIGSGIAFYVYLMTQERPELADAPANYTCHFPEREACEQANIWLQNLYEKHPVPSISAALSLEGKTVWSATIGVADIQQNIAAQADTQYQIGSISKSLTAALTLKLQEQGKLNIHDNFQSYVKDFAETNHASYTLAQLLSHRSGIRHYKDELSESLNETHYPTTRAAAEIVEEDALVFRPGSDFLYSSYAYSVLALALEAATERSYVDLVEQELVSVLGLTHTTLNIARNTERYDEEKVSQKASPYLLLGSRLFAAPELDYSNKYAGAGFLSTPSDLLVFGNALLAHEYLSSSSVTQLFSTADSSSNYALGFRINNANATHPENGPMIYHGGTINGGYSFFALYPDKQGAIAFATNAVPSPPSSLDREESANTLLAFFTQQ
ncbi:beta-lactamase family protein [Glaciecola sp. MH2013]|uniref:serine hydrolase domain-containing protein n=1 Tax=Glaciecola sp. MH2013 TaxID=2785524 RepID=UPI00189F6904|nr:serine hydrolase domain-containing protein [Glaciecola sp. MH2013]MBF7074155.1 beta-lactamase family protein [Glaciecola sp. MH2013]